MARTPRYSSGDKQPQPGAPVYSQQLTSDVVWRFTCTKGWKIKQITYTCSLDGLGRKEKKMDFKDRYKEGEVTN